MGLFRRKKREPIVHPPVERTIYVETTLGGLLPHINDYGRVMGSRARGLGTEVDRAFEWIRIQLPTEDLHPWEAVNLALWLSDLGRVVVTSSASPTFPAHWLTTSPAGGDLLEGRAESGEPVTVHVPSNKIVWPDDEVTVPATSTVDYLASVGIPRDGWVEHGTIVVMSEDPQDDLAPNMGDIVPTRAALHPSGIDFSI